jgi:uncharacterized repeat protein (TIGR01451 family)
MNLKKLLAGGVIVACLTALSLMLATSPAQADLAVIVHTTLEDFNAGTLYHTGLTSYEGGEVQLMAVGLAGEWITTTNTTGLIPLERHTAVYHNGHILVLGGRDADQQARREVYYTTILPDHDLADWQTTTPLPSSAYSTGIYWHASVVVNDRVYVLGGNDGASNFSTVSFAPINSDGTVGDWQATASLPEDLRILDAAVVNGRIYVVGGRGSSSPAGSDKVYFAEPDSEGDISGWTTATEALPHTTYGHMVAAYEGILYLMGGTHPSVQVSPYTHFAIPETNGQITSWEQTTNMAVNRYGGEAVSFRGVLFTTGGSDNIVEAPSAYVGATLIDEDTGDVGAWQDTSLIEPARYWHATVHSEDEWIYVILGSDGSGPIEPKSINRGTTAGVSEQYADDGTFTSHILDFGGGNRQLIELSWNTTMTDTSTMTITMSYRKKSTTGDWSEWYGPFPSSLTPGTVTTTLALAGTAHYFQYEAQFATQFTNTTPVLNAVKLIYDVPVCNIELSQASVPPSGELVSPGQIISYTFAYVNAGEGITTTNTSINDELPQYATYVPGSIFGPGSDDSNPQEMRWDLGTVNPDDSGVVGFAVMVDDPLPGGYVLENDAWLSSSECAVVSDLVVHTTFIEGPDLIVDDITLNEDCPEAGDDVSFDVIVRNVGTGDAPDPFWVEIYVKPWPSEEPDGPSDHDQGYCVGDCSQPRLNYIEYLPALNEGGQYLVTFGDTQPLIFPAEGKYDIYVQADVYDEDDPASYPDWGRHAEEDESNNIGHMTVTTCGVPPIFMPIVLSGTGP